MTSDILCIKCKKSILETVSDENIKTIDNKRYSICVECVADEVISLIKTDNEFLSMIKFIIKHNIIYHIKNKLIKSKNKQF